MSLISRFISKIIRFLPFKPVKKFVYSSRIQQLEVSKKKPMFGTVYFQVRTRCNNRCSFCAASVFNEKRKDISMSIEIYKKAIKELAELNFDGTIAYHVNNEPLIFKDLVEFVKIARGMLPGCWIQILTNGRALNYKLGKDLLEAGINEMSVNIYNDDFHSPIPKGVRVFRDELLLEYYPSDKIGKGHRVDKEMPGDVFRFNIFRRRLTQILSSRGGSAPNKKSYDEVYGFCEFPFTQLNINADGTVSKCCSDFYFLDPMGNIKDSTIMEIWNGNNFNSVREKLIEGQRAYLKNCNECDYYGVKKIRFCSLDIRIC